ncbi:MAG TPA: Sec-independent protein translocase protein TatB [Acetobacteraceae bacterium]|jgi:sec-independent protein translocase protein TatB|nr:Sec-independent protein translocase protein TatB [Acetobacteraceae bacterium]
MFDFAWSEIGLIAAVALILIGPKDMPVAIRSITDMIKKARRMASEFQTHVDEMMREADLGDVRDQINSIRNFDFRGELERRIDPDHSLRDTFTGNPLEPAPASDVLAAPAPVEEAAVAELGPIVLPAPEAPEQSMGQESIAPAFIPPEFVLHAAAACADTEAPAFIPPPVVRHGPRLTA